MVRVLPLTLCVALGVPTVTAVAQEVEHPLVVAAADGNVAGVRALLNQGADPNEADESQGTALLGASWAGHLEVAQLLLDAGARVDDGDESRTTALMAASGAGHLALVQLLLERGADPRRQDAEGDDALHFAVFGSATEVVKLLLAKGADPNGRNATGQTPLLLAAQRDSIELLRFLLDQGADVGARDDDGDGVLSYAAFGGPAEAAALLMERGADPSQANANGGTPLMQAAASDNSPVLKALLDHGAELATADVEGSTALHYAARASAVHAVSLLLDRGIDPNVMANGWTAWMLAVAQFDTATASALEAGGAVHDESLRTAIERTTEAAGWAQGMRVPAALASLQHARALVHDIPISGEILNLICWNGTIAGMAREVAGTCEEAVTTLPKTFVRDSRGLNRAARGDLVGARADFESFVAEVEGDARALREGWIRQLDAGTNPITPRVLESLRYPWLAGSAIAASRQLGFDLIAMVPEPADLPDSALISREMPNETSGFQRVYTAGGASFAWGGAQLSGIVFNATLMGGAELAASGVSDIEQLSEQAFRAAFVASLSASMGFHADSAVVERVALDDVAMPRTAWRISSSPSDETRPLDIHLVFFARQRIVGTCLIVGLGEVIAEDVTRIVRVFESRVLAALPEG